MPGFRKASADLVDRFRATMADLSRRRRCATRSDRRARTSTATWPWACTRSGWFVRLDPAGPCELTAAGGEPFMPMPGRPMTGFTMLPGPRSWTTPRAAVWIDASLAYVATLPPKEARAGRSVSAAKPALEQAGRVPAQEVQLAAAGSSRSRPSSACERRHGDGQPQPRMGTPTRNAITAKPSTSEPSACAKRGGTPTRAPSAGRA